MNSSLCLHVQCLILSSLAPKASHVAPCLLGAGQAQNGNKGPRQHLQLRAPDLHNDLMRFHKIEDLPMAPQRLRSADDLDGHALGIGQQRLQACLPLQWQQVAKEEVSGTPVVGPLSQ